jgi:hypothetical protein
MNNLTRYFQWRFYLTGVVSIGLPLFLGTPTPAIPASSPLVSTAPVLSLAGVKESLPASAASSLPPHINSLISSQANDQRKLNYDPPP